MTTTVHCTGKKRHRRWTVQKAAVEFSEQQELSRCPCGAARVIEITHKKPDGSVDDYTVVRVARLFSDKEAEERGYNPMGWVLRENDGGEVLQLVYWTKNRYKQWWWGQNPPILGAEHLRKLLRKLGIDWAS